MLVETTTPYTPEQDGAAEHSICTIVEKLRAMMIDQAIPLFLWPEVLQAIVYIMNRTATQTLNGMTPFEAFMKQANPERAYKPSVSHLQVLGCKTYMQIPKE